MAHLLGVALMNKSGPSADRKPESVYVRVNVDNGTILVPGFWSPIVPQPKLLVHCVLPLLLVPQVN